MSRLQNNVYCWMLLPQDFFLYHRCIQILFSALWNGERERKKISNKITTFLHIAKYVERKK